MQSSKQILITGSAGLIGSEAVRYFTQLGWQVTGIDNNMRADFFGPDGDTSWNLQRLQTDCPDYQHYSLDIRDRPSILKLLAEQKFDLIIHAAAQPSHDLAASRPFDDFDVNAVGTLNLLEATRQYCPEAVFCFLSTNKVYGDAPNKLPLVELETRWDYGNPEDYGGIAETFSIDQSKHSLFGASKVAADVMVQEYGRYFGMKTACFRGGCLTGSAHSAAELHGFLAYVMRACAEGREYKIYGYKGKQVRDNIHAYDVCALLHQFYLHPRCGEVYNLGGGRGNSISVMEALAKAEQLLGKTFHTTYVDQNRQGDHICYISDLTKIKSHFPHWQITRSLDSILEEMAVLHRARSN
ncbi:NAD-dependent epimerase/dehydratase family protein [Synechocystis salina LEGE 06099]|uniref:NAD-dependent epimerase/dehydratase family protein n=1 Tax=Synechocystis salina TaxID=945780 RepID=UPI0018808831|nr:NAD-dependent epimerase/dehydratase family protein [Synechocystis salina]MBE9203877.1 NAD-dependent epimerase/dehydratase family protein [Synechocystis salina LEGE 06099]